jgi:catechol 2,3-dioxygenase-like lactoylglutathione lyase family enzyme
MYAKIDHVAIKVNNLEESVQFFEEVFGMEIEKTAGEKPVRKVWFKEGIQLNEEAVKITAGGVMDHIGIYTDNEDIILEKSRKYGCRNLPNGENWIQTPAGLIIELKVSVETAEKRAPVADRFW